MSTSPDYADGLVNDDDLGWASDAPTHPARATLAAIAASIRATGRNDDGAWMDRVQAVCLASSEVADRLHDLAEFARTCRKRPDLVTPEGALGVIAGALAELAWKVTPS